MLFSPEGGNPENIRPLRRAEYDRLVDAGSFDGERVELIGGRLVAMSPQGERHAFSVTRLTKLLVLALGDRADVRVQVPLAASDISEPEPDIAIVAPGDYLDDHPQRAILVIEVAQASLGHDRTVKKALYAAAGVPEYWIVNLEAGLVEVYREPQGEIYRAQSEYGRDATIAVPGFDDVRVAVGDVIPGR
jgi:Uma2 family endonuclease